MQGGEGVVILAVLAALRGKALRRRGMFPLVDVTPMRTRPVGIGRLGQFLLFTGMAAYFLVLLPYLVGTRNAAPRNLG